MVLLETALTFIIVFAILVVFHELGHFWAARAFKIPVEEFAVGFGPKLITLAKRGLTEYTIRAIPMGGFVRIKGMEIEEPNPAEVTDEARAEAPVDNADGFNKRSVLQRFIVILAGPIASLLLGYLAYVVLFSIWGRPTLNATIGALVEGKPAQSAGLRVGDRVVDIDATPVTIETLVATIDASQGRPMDIHVVGVDQKDRHVSVTALKDNDAGKSVYRIGIRPTLSFEPCSNLEAWMEAAKTTALYGQKLSAIVKAGKTKDAVGGPVGIARTFHDMAGTGVQTRIELLASLSLSLFIFNLFPIPILDGGHLMIYTIEAIRRRKLSPVTMQRAYMGGMAIMGTLFIAMLWNDIAKWFFIK